MISYKKEKDCVEETLLSDFNYYNNPCSVKINNSISEMLTLKIQKSRFGKITSWKLQ